MLLRVGCFVEFGGPVDVETRTMKVRGLQERGARKALRPHF